MSNSPLLEGPPPPPRAPPGEDPILRKATKYLFISLVLSVPAWLFTVLWLEGIMFSRHGYPTCGSGPENPLPCSLVLVPLLLAISTFAFNAFALYKLGKRKKPGATGVSGAIAAALAEAEDQSWDETTPLLGGTGVNDDEEGRPDSPRGPGPIGPIPHIFLAWTRPFAALWVIFLLAALVDITPRLIPGSRWDPLDAEAWGVLLLLLTVQAWTTSIAALAFTRLRSIDTISPESAGSVVSHPKIPVTQTQAKLTHSVVLLALLLPLMVEGNIHLFRLLLITLILDFAFLLAIDVRVVLRRSRTEPRPQEDTAEFTSYLLRRILFTLISACTFLLALTWVAWSILTVVAGTLSMLRDTFPDWDIIYLPIPERGWETWVWLEAGVDLWQGCTLGTAALYSWMESRGGAY